ncbi:lysoplasmalogenase [Ferdinandcohnia quinoae]|uniref:Lysoplasmalogenase n=1 Tax=Fredinandcohnia quinoae TaxID=2918902 RepID=A0AAW5DZC5_9BACI|nr:lysoplasmalogenase [Fredinandcohnia sp. SECRCQ15]MCH1626011.1 lysoplasmalogenase [Fredinandcohnia sp. SECRCQ15]
MKRLSLPLLIFVSSVLYIFIIPDEPLLFKLTFKLIPMWLIITYAFIHYRENRSFTSKMIVTGLIFCMFGDGLLHWFLIGLSAFLLGHIFYIIAFFKEWHFSLIRVLSIIPIGFYAIFIGNRLTSSLIEGGNITLLIPVIAYLIIISIMAWSAIMTNNRWAIMGSILFVISDSILAWNRFVSDVPYSAILIMTTYYTAQFFIAKSIIFFQKRD